MDSRLHGQTDLPVMKPYVLRGHQYDEMFLVRWLGSLPPWSFLVLLALWPAAAFAQSASFGTADAFVALWRWIPFLTFQGFLFNVLISLFAMLIGTTLGAALGLAQVSRNKVTRGISWSITQLFRNSPWLVLLFVVLLAFPFEINVFGLTIPIPAWVKAVIGLSLPVMANISEIVRGAVNSVPSAQWEAAESLSFTRTQTLWQIILPQCFKRMIPPWMNWYAILTMATPLCSLLGVGEIITFSRQAMEAENNHPELLMPFYGYALVLFFAYCYPIARLTIALERRYSVKL
ncbi:polar amino acid transport system permease protein [Mameliella alba]|uniref:amino acid ABC transporter permease n=1 Tax=Mameliella alba TaxID=561184 RepID=UPI00088B09D3|nr:amino acid ABC transporter permease [Mameliella alba]PTR42113.1 amino acid ABC transporter membrane protein 2 (PAAT family) [Mameliella alba]GGF55192.1 amino acid ABC transporter [Mameliella alba]SDB99144.1 polar amino acid transport system permease protein [Mameliella alba]